MSASELTRLPALPEAPEGALPELDLQLLAHGRNEDYGSSAYSAGMVEQEEVEVPPPAQEAKGHTGASPDREGEEKEEQEDHGSKRTEAGTGGTITAQAAAEVVPQKDEVTDPPKGQQSIGLPDTKLDEHEEQPSGSAIPGVAAIVHTTEPGAELVSEDDTLPAKASATAAVAHAVTTEPTADTAEASDDELDTGKRVSSSTKPGDEATDRTTDQTTILAKGDPSPEADGAGHGTNHHGGGHGGEGEGGKDREDRTAKEIINGFRSTSGVAFAYGDIRGGFMDYRHSLEGVTEDEIIAHATEMYGGALLTRFSREEILHEGRYEMACEDIGGAGITDRSLSDIEEEVMPGITSRLLNDPGRITIEFLGNGLSLAPLEVLDRRAADLPSPHIVVVDAFDYTKLLHDLDSLEAALSAQGHSFPNEFAGLRSNCRTLVGAINAGRIEAVRHTVGRGEMPVTMRGADVAINSYGPPASTVNAQLECLRPDGQLYISTMDPLPLLPGMSVTPLFSDGLQAVAHIVRARSSG